MRHIAALLILATAAGAAAHGPFDFDSVRRAADSLAAPDPHLRAVFRAALLDAGRQASVGADGTVYVKTGDIPAEWLRDSSVQVRPTLFFARQDPAVRAFLKAVILRQARMLAADPYANAFRADYSVWEEKFELDSLAYPIELAWTYWKATGDASVFTPEVARGLGGRPEDHARRTGPRHEPAPLHSTASSPTTRSGAPA